MKLLARPEIVGVIVPGIHCGRGGELTGCDVSRRVCTEIERRRRPAADRQRACRARRGIGKGLMAAGGRCRVTDRPRHGRNDRVRTRRAKFRTHGCRTGRPEGSRAGDRQRRRAPHRHGHRRDRDCRRRVDHAGEPIRLTAPHHVGGADLQGKILDDRRPLIEAGSAPPAWLAMSPEPQCVDQIPNCATLECEKSWLVPVKNAQPSRMLGSVISPVTAVVVSVLTSDPLI